MSTTLLASRTARITTALALGAITAGISIGSVDASDRASSSELPSASFEIETTDSGRDADVIGTLEPTELTTDDGVGGRTVDANWAIETAPQGSPLQGAADLKAGPGCSITCITGGVAFQHGPDVRLRVRTDTPAQIWIIVWNDDGYHRIQSSLETDLTEFQAIFGDVELESTYYAMAVAEDAQGYSDHADGEFTTGQRHVRIEFGAPDVYAAPEGSAMDRFAYVNEETRDVGGFPSSTTRHGAERHLDLTAFGVIEIDHRDRELCEVHEAQVGPDATSYSEDNCFVVAGVYRDDIDLDERPANAGGGSHTIDTTLQHAGGGGLPPGYGQQLRFSVPVELTVWYGS